MTAPGKPTDTSSLHGLKIVLTGTFTGLKRSAVKTLLKSAGAKVASSVSGKTELLVYGSGAGSKLDDALSRSIPTMTDYELYDLLATDARFSSDVTSAKAEVDAMLAPVRAIAEPVWADQRERWGMTLGELLRAWIHAFSQRPDIHVSVNKIGAGAPIEAMTRFARRIPASMLAFHHEIGSAQFTYVLGEHTDEMSNYSDGYRGGKFDLVGLERFAWYPRPDYDDYNTYELEGTFDWLQPEGYTVLVKEPEDDYTRTQLVFNDDDRPTLGDVKTYITDGASRGFVWYWPRHSYWEAVDFTARLFDYSPPKDTPADDVHQRLTDLGLSERQAQGRTAWLGESAVIPLHDPERAAAAAAAADS